MIPIRRERSGFLKDNALKAISITTKSAVGRYGTIMSISTFVAEITAKLRRFNLYLFAKD